MKINLTEKMKKRSIVSKGNIDRILKLISKAESGQDINIAFLGGSITQGCNATEYKKCYVSLVYKWFKDKFKNINVKCINAGVGATGSLIGAHRAYVDVISKNPDIVFVDASVNDDESKIDQIAYESEIRRLLSSRSKPAVIEVFMAKFDLDNVQNQETKVGLRYGVPMISYRDAIYDDVKSGEIDIEDLITDEVHPNDNGHEIITNLLTSFIEDIYENSYEKNKEINIVDNTLNISCVYGDKFIDGKILNNTSLVPTEIKEFEKFNEGFQVFHDAWIYRGNNTGKLMFDIECKNVILLYKKLVDKKAGKFKVRVNGEEKVTIDSYFKDGWGDWSVTEVLEESNEVKKYTIEIETIRELEDKEIIILGFLVS